MTRYVVGRKCDAVEWVFVDADNVVEARLKAKDNENVAFASNTLEFSKYQTNELWLVKDISGDELTENPNTVTDSVTTSSEKTTYSEWDIDYNHDDASPV